MSDSSESSNGSRRVNSGTISVSLNVASVAALVAVLWGGNAAKNSTMASIEGQTAAVSQTHESILGVRNEVAKVNRRLEELEKIMSVVAAMNAELQLLEARLAHLESCALQRRNCKKEIPR